VIQYEGAKPTGPLAEFWDLTPAAGEEPRVADKGGQGHGTHSMHGDGSITATADAATIAMEDDRFDPASLTVPAGTTVTWTNAGADWHSVAAFDGSFESVQLASGETFSHTFTTPGIYKFICKHHARQGMIGEIIVTG
jgi:plastocyanin